MFICLIAYVSYCLFMIEFPECEACYLDDRFTHVSLLDPFITQFLCIVPILKHCMVRMSLICGLGSS